MMNAVLQRPMFRPQIVRRQTGTPSSGETTSTTRVMEGPIDSFKFNLLDKLGVISNKTFKPDVPDQDFQINIDDAMASPQLLNTVFDMIMSSTDFDLESFMNMGASQQQDYINTIKGKLIFGKTDKSTIREGEFNPQSSVTREGEFNPQTSVIREGEKPLLDLFKNLIGRGEPISDEVLREGEFDSLLSRLSGVIREGETLPPSVLEAMGRAEGSPMEGERSDAVGIADGLDKEMPKADPNTTGVAKVSPEQYVELMNQVRGDEVPMEGRVQELAMTVGEKDAQDTPLSVLALVQPVFELQEQQGGLAAAPGAQQMMQQAPMMMKEGGIVYRENGTDQEGENAFSSLAAAGFDKNMLDAVQLFGKEYFGVGSEFDTQAARQQYEQMLINKSQMRDQAYLDAAPLLLQLGATALNPEASISDVFTVGASNLAKFGTNVGKQTKALQDQALKLALADKQKEENKESAYMSAIAPKLLETAFKDPQTVALTALDITSKNLENLEKEMKLGVLDESLKVQLATDIATLEKMKTEEKYLGTTLQLNIETQLEQLYGIQYDNQNKVLQNEYQTITNKFVEGEKNAELDGLLLDNLNKQLNNAKLGIENEYIRTEKDLGIEKLNADIDSVLGKNAGQAITNEKGLIELENFDAMQTLELIKKQEEINELIAKQKELNFEQINSEANFRKEFKQLQVYKNTDLRYTAFNNLIAAAAEDTAAGDVAFIFEFMRMVDPNSVVREGEFQLAEDASPLMFKLEKLLNKAKTGERLLGTQRDEFLSTAGSILEKSVNIYNDTEAEYKRIAGNIFKDSDVSNIVVGIQFDENILGSLDNEKAFDAYLKELGIE